MVKVNLFLITLKAYEILIYDIIRLYFVYCIFFPYLLLSLYAVHVSWGHKPYTATLEASHYLDPYQSVFSLSSWEGYMRIRSHDRTPESSHIMTFSDYLNVQ